MNITIGVYDLFTYAIPGSLYLTLIAYISARTEWVDLQDVEATSVLGIVAVVVVSYLLGHVTYGLSRYVERRIRWGRAKGSGEPVRSLQRDAREVFLSRHPAAERRSYVHTDLGMLRAAIDLQSHEGAMEIRRMQAVGLMLRGCAPALVVGTLVAGTEIFTGDEPAFAVCAAGLLLASAAAATAQGWRLTLWANIKTFELAFWVPDIDRPLDDEPRPDEPGQPAD